MLLRRATGRSRGDVVAALLAAAPASVEHGQAGEADGEVGALAGLAGQPDRLEVVRLGVVPPVGGRAVPGDHASAGRAASPRAARSRSRDDRLVDLRRGPARPRAARATPASAVGWRNRPSDRSFGVDQRRRRAAEPLDALGARTRQHQRHARGHRRPGRARSGRPTSSRAARSRRGTHRRRGRAEVEADVDGVGVEPDGRVGVGRLDRFARRPGAWPGRRRSEPHRVSTAPRTSWMCARSTRVGRPGQRPVEQVEGALGLAGQPGGARRRRRGAGSGAVGDAGELGGALEGVGGDGVRAAGGRLPGDFGEGAARSPRRARPLPPTGATRAGRSRARARRAASARCTARRVSGSAAPYTAERTSGCRNSIRSPSDRHQSGVLGLGESRVAEPEHGAGLVDGGDAGAVRRRHQERRPGVARRGPATRPMKARLSSSETATGESAGTASIRSSRSPSSSIASGFPAGGAEQPEQLVAGGSGRSRSSRAPARPRRPGRTTSSVGRLAQHGRPGLAGAHRHQEGDRVRQQPASGEHQRLRGRVVDQVPVVDEYGEGPVLGGPAQEAQGRRAHREPTGLGVGPGAEQQRGGERGGLRSRGSGRAAGAPVGAAGGVLRTGRTARTPRPEQRSTCISSTRPAASVSRAVLPMPGSPLSTSTRLSPTRAPARSVAMVRRSESRPTSTSRL